MPTHDHQHAARDGHGHHHHRRHASGDERRLGWAFLVIFGFMLVEVVGGVISGSLALIADAGHMASDAAALGMSFAALRIGRRPADEARSYGYRRLEVLVAFVNGCALFVIAGWITVEALRRLASPAPILGGAMLGVAVVGLAANLVALAVLEGGNRASLSLRSASLHVLGDLLAFVAAIVAASVILATDWTPIDPLLSIVVVLLILKSAGGIVRSSAHILLEGTPAGLDLDALEADLAAQVPAIAGVHHIHAWSLTPEEALVTLHVRCTPGADPAVIIPAINRRLSERFGVTHSTIQIDAADCADEHHR
jgi:cobalt-zinc-cadmium efflux system protein